MAALPRLRTAAYSALPPSCNCYHSLSSSSHSPYSPYASTSAITLDDPPPPSYQALAPTWLSGRQPRRAKGARNEGEKQAVQRRRAVERRASLPFAAMEKDARAATRPTRQPASDRTQISPFLPLVTRERNHLLSTFRQALYSRSSPSTSSPSFRGAGGRRTPKTKRQAWDPDAVWVSLAKALRYPEEIPELPHSHFPSSTRAPANLYDDDADFASSPSTFTAEDGGFFSSAHPSTSPSPSPSSASSLYPPPHPLNPSSTDRADLRAPLRLSFPELKRAFTILSSARPRTREGLSRLLVVAELMARQKGAVMEDEGAGGGKEGGGGGVTRLRGGGKGLDEQDWAQLLLFAGVAMRTTRPEPEMKSVLGLYGQYLALEKEKRARRGGRGVRGLSLREKKRKVVLYNVLLHLAARAKMFDLFEQVRGRMRDEGLLGRGEREGEMGNVATSVAELGKAGLMGSPVEVLWSIFEVGVMVAAAEGRSKARGSKAAPFGSRAGMGPLWAAMAWWLAQRGYLDDAQRMYDAMKAQRRVDLRSLRPAAITLEDDDAHPVHPAPPPFFLFPPPPSQGVVTGSIQACCFRGDFEGAMRMLREVLAGKDRRVRPSVHVFQPIFRMFGRFGKALSGSTGGGGRGGGDLSRTLLSGDQVNAYASRHSSSPSSSPLRSLSSALSSSTTNDAHPSNPLTLSALSSLFDLFLSLSAPPSATHPTLPFSGQRTAPSAKEIFWILFAFEKLSGGDSAVVVEVYGLLVGKFRDKADEGWTGWRMDKRVMRMVRGHVEKIEELQRRWEEVQ